MSAPSYSAVRKHVPSTAETTRNSGGHSINRPPSLGQAASRPQSYVRIKNPQVVNANPPSYNDVAPHPSSIVDGSKNEDSSDNKPPSFGVFGHVDRT
ncbi:hypothetical protein CTI12_AA415110 [Artemisia annua]|uniref:Uncharacterized protein n=1 Tax=Artemisia annua TaxID=35608 RepID=A0A2U1M697_ARTAN|nr:hypothetical protein CTI12_AA415110 [Artemisia annua]